MNRRHAFGFPGLNRCPSWLRLIACLALLSALAACGGGPAQHARVQYNPSRYYPPPGPPNDPWGPYIHEASGRFGVPENWIRRVMRQESGGQEDVISWAGAMGLMQVMPDTYDGLRQRYNLGNDPFDPHNNILAGTAYLREMYNRFGSPGFLAAYNAGPNRVDSYLNNGTPLPAETVNYVASIAPSLGPETPMSGPLAVYGAQFAARPTPAGCDPDAAYNPDGPCTKLRPATEAPVIMAAAGNCDPDAAYDPTQPCQRSPAAPLYAEPAPVVAESLAPPMPARRPAYASRRPLQETMALPVAFAPGPPPGHWAIQVGAFANLATAQTAAENARSDLPERLRTAKIELPATTPFGHQVAFRARLSGLSPSAAADACSRLTSLGDACITVPPSADSF
jgi:D-alanyl-D-alanine carboxypeptidase